MTGSSFVRLKFGLSADYISFACERILPDITNNRLSRLCEPRIDTKPVVLHQADIFTPAITPSLSSYAKPIFYHSNYTKFVVLRQAKYIYPRNYTKFVVLRQAKYIYPGTINF